MKNKDIDINELLGKFLDDLIQDYKANKTIHLESMVNFAKIADKLSDTNIKKLSSLIDLMSEDKFEMMFLHTYLADVSGGYSESKALDITKAVSYISSKNPYDFEKYQIYNLLVWYKKFQDLHMVTKNGHKAV
jgi:UDP-glucose 4-epimerase